MKYTVRYLALVIVGLAVGSAAAARGDEGDPVSSYLEGQITVNAEIDSSGDYSGFNVVVGLGTDQGGLDTLGIGVTDRSGRFAMEIAAPSRGVYSVLISRGGDVLTIGDIAISDGDSAKLRIEFPLSSNWLPLRSRENASWLAYNNTRIQHTRQLEEMFEDRDTVMGDSLAAHFRQTANLLWNLRATFPNTIGAEFGSAESVVLLEGWDDSLAVARARQISPRNSRYTAVGRAARRAVGRLAGQEAALSFLRDYRDRAQVAEDRAALQAEVVRAHLDSLEKDQAIEAAQTLKEEFPDTPWADWADRAEYEAANLMPGMPAPTFAGSTAAGGSFDLENMSGQVVILEFWAPQSSNYRRQLPQINQLAEQIVSDSVAWVAVNLESDTDMYSTFSEGRSLPGVQVQATTEEAESLIEQYNISSLPTRFIIDRQGNIVGKYIGSLASLRSDVLRYLDISATADS